MEVVGCVYVRRDEGESLVLGEMECCVGGELMAEVEMGGSQMKCEEE